MLKSPNILSCSEWQCFCDKWATHCDSLTRLTAFAQVTENPRRASIAIRRQSLIQSLQDDNSEKLPPGFYHTPARSSIGALMPGSTVSPADGRIRASGKRYSVTEQGKIVQSFQQLLHSEASRSLSQSRLPASRKLDVHADRMAHPFVEHILANSCNLQSAAPAWHREGAAPSTEEAVWYAPTCIPK